MFYDAACVYAVASSVVKNNAHLREEYAQRAISLLNQLVKTGCYSSGAGAGNLEYDPDLESVRRREDF
jgi:hypothetical protein